MKCYRSIAVAALALAGTLAIARPAVALEYVNLLDEPGVGQAQRPEPQKMYYITYQCRDCQKVHNGGVANDLNYLRILVGRYQAQGYRVHVETRVAAPQPPTYKIRYDVTYQDPRDGKWYYGGSADWASRNWAVARGRAIEAHGYRATITARRVPQ